MIYFFKEKESNKIKQLLGPALISKIKEIGGIYLCGGALTSIFRRADINDFDLYFSKQESFEQLNSFLSGTSSGFKEVFKSDNAVTYLGDTLNSSGENSNPLIKNKKIQLIKKEQVFRKTVEDVLSCFDFTICQAAYLFDKDMFVSHENFIFDLAKRELILNEKCSTPLNTLIRLRKFLSRGFEMPPKQMFKLAILVNKLDLSNKEDLRQQLMGLGSQEINEFLDRLKSDGEVNVEELLQDILK